MVCLFVCFFIVMGDSISEDLNMASKGQIKTRDWRGEGKYAKGYLLCLLEIDPELIDSRWH